MNFWLGIQVGLKEIAAHKFRSALTMLGIVLGVASLVGMLALVAGMTRGWQQVLHEVGGLEKVSVIDQDPPPHQTHLKEISPGRTLVDAAAIRANCPLIGTVSPEVNFNGQMAVRGNKSFKFRVFAGGTETFLDVNTHELEHGRFITALDLEKCHHVCVIGTRVRDELFGMAEDQPPVIPLGEIIEINGQPFTIIGLFQYYETERARKEREGGRADELAARAERRRSSGSGRGRGGQHRSNWFDWKNEVVVVPLTTMQLLFQSGAVGGAADPHLTDLNLKVKDATHLEEAIQQVKNVLLFTHNGVEDFGFNTQENWADRINETTGNARRTGGLIASISLIVGGIGIMNIMLASISERIRELGIRKAIGARDRDVFLQIIVESTVLATLGGLVGLGVAFGLVKLLERLAPFDFSPVVQTEALLAGFVFSAAVGVLAGLYPAWKAARLDPIEALRYE